MTADVNSQWLYEIEHQCEYKDLDPYIVQAIIFVESSWKPDVVGGECIGLMQIHPCWAKGRNLFDPIANIQVGTEVLRYYFDTYGSEVSALNHYNGTDAEGITSYSEKVLSLSEEIFFRSKRTGLSEGDADGNT